MLDESEMLKIISEYEHISDSVEKMIAVANENGGKDNITIILIKIEV
jgi:serine/threonine protein phosphatase PrpC